MKTRIRYNMSITKKLFFITTFIFALFIGGTLIIQSAFFESFYLSRKKNDVKNAMEDFKRNYDKLSDIEPADNLIEEYEATNNIGIVILDSSNRLKYIPRPIRNRYGPNNLRELTEFIDEWIKNSNNIKELKDINQTKVTIIKATGIVPGSIISITPDNKRNETIFAISSLRPINEAVLVIRQLYLYISIGAFFVIIVLSFIYSTMIAKPLIRINRVATKMSQLNFSEKCEVSSKDEIGNVASSLNFLSENLNSAITSLKKANAKLEEDIEKERNLEKMRREFVASVSHELKTPITLIDGYAVGLKDDIFKDEEKDYYLDIIIDETRKMGSLVSDMLDLSHFESGIFKLIQEELNLSELIGFTVRRFKTLIPEKHVTISMNLIDNVRVYADWSKMEQVITNFITNALRHVNENGTIRINMLEKDTSILIEIENTGSKIPEDELSKIWGKFYKVDKSGNRQLGGTGLGLSIVKNILELHNYTYGVRNTDSGIAFYFEVPKL